MSSATGRLLRPRRATWLALALALSIVAVGGVEAQAAASRAECKVVTKTVGKWKVKVLCGPARASVTYEGKTTTVRGGKCTWTKRSFSVDIGSALQTKQISGGEQGVPDYLSVELGKGMGLEPILGAQPVVGKDGTYHKGFVMFAVGGTLRFEGSTSLTITLRKNRTRGTFSIPRSSPYSAVYGKFSC